MSGLRTWTPTTPAPRPWGADSVSGPADKEDGAPGYSVRNLEGRLWSFGNYDPFAEE